MFIVISPVDGDGTGRRLMMASWRRGCPARATGRSTLVPGGSSWCRRRCSDLGTAPTSAEDHGHRHGMLIPRATSVPGRTAAAVGHSGVQAGDGLRHADGRLRMVGRDDGHAPDRAQAVRRLLRRTGAARTPFLASALGASHISTTHTPMHRKVCVRRRLGRPTVRRALARRLPHRLGVGCSRSRRRRWSPPGSTAGCARSGSDRAGRLLIFGPVVSERGP